MSTLVSEISIGWGDTGETLGYTLLKTDGTTAQARTTSGVAEDGTSAYYSVRPTFDSTWGPQLVVRWDDGTTANVVRDTFRNPAYGLATAGTAPSTGYIGTIAPAGTIANVFTSNGAVDLSGTFTVSIYRNELTTPTATATIGTKTTTSLAYSYTISGTFVAGDTIRAVLTDASSNVLATHRYDVAASGGGGAPAISVEQSIISGGQ